MKKPDQKSRDFSHLLIWKDGELIPLPEAQVHILSHSFGRGSAVFEVLSTHRAEKGTFVFRLKDHLNRLFRSARALYMKIPYAQKTLIQAIKQVVASNQLGEGLLKILVFYPDICLEITPPQKNLSVAVAGFDFQRDISWNKFGEDKFAKAGIRYQRLCSRRSHREHLYCKKSKALYPQTGQHPSQHYQNEHPPACPGFKNSGPGKKNPPR